MEGAYHYPGVEEGAPGVDPVAAEAVEAFFTLYNRMHAHYAGICGSLDLTPQAGTVLRALRAPSPMREFARGLGLDASNLTGVVDRLEARGLVERRHDPLDRRVRLLVPTPAGTGLRRRLDERLFTAPPLLAGLDTAQREQLRALLARAVSDPPPPTAPAPPALGAR